MLGTTDAAGAALETARELVSTAAQRDAKVKDAGGLLPGSIRQPGGSQSREGAGASPRAASRRQLGCPR